MKALILILPFLFFACKDSSNEIKLVDNDSTRKLFNKDSSLKSFDADTSKSAGTIQYAWLVDFENKTKKRNPKFKSEYLNVDSLINVVNRLYPNIKLEQVKVSGDTLFTKIMDSKYLGERMGTSGAALYIAELIINLTSVDKIKYVKIDFEEGSHATPGIWSANDFNDYKEIR